MTYLSEQFRTRMEQMLDREFPDFLSSFFVKPSAGLRVNTAKISPEQFCRESGWELRQIPWIENGFYYPDELPVSKDPYYYAGLYYLQEPSAMTPANLLGVTPGMRVLDLCAAPGGKSTEIAARLKGKGVLVANDISNTRARALLKNLEVFGAPNILVTSETPKALSERFPQYFDRILVDAPCSGEGMFRKQPAIMKNWEQYGTEYYAKLQREILPLAEKMLAPGGRLLYSTCTFSPEEDEEMVDWFMKECPSMHITDAIDPSRHEEYAAKGIDFGHPEWMQQPNEALKKAVRLFPHKLEGEGHFLAVLEKDAEEEMAGIDWERRFLPAKKLPKELVAFFERCSMPLDFTRVMEKDGRYYVLPSDIPNLSGLRLLRTGLLLGELKKDRFVPSQALAMALRKEEYPNCCSLPYQDERVVKYLKCESIELPDEVPDGYVLICVGDHPLGFAKKKGAQVKNQYLPGWRLM